MDKKVLLTGATGMIGALVAQHCLQNDQVSKVTSLVRRSSGLTHEKLEEIEVDNFSDIEKKIKNETSIDTVFYCLGVYTGAVNRQEFYAITVVYPETLAKVLHKTNPDLRFCLLSGAGADRAERSRMMFAKDKGIIENRLSQMNFGGGFHALRPGYIYPVTPRKEPNISYKIFRLLYPALKLFGKNTSIRSTDLAAAMFEVGMRGSDLEILENKDILQIAQNL